MAHDLVWRVRDRAALKRRFQLMFARTERRDRAAERLVEKFIEDVTLYPLEWPVSAEPPSDDEWRFGNVSVRYRRYPSHQLIEVIEIHADQETIPDAQPYREPAPSAGNTGATEESPSVN